MLIEFKNVNIQQPDTEVLSNVDFCVNESEFIYVIGKVGTGKSSLLKTTYCELPAEVGNGGKAVVLGRDLTTIRRKDIPALRREMGIIFQDFQLLHDRSVYGNLRFVLRATGWKRTDVDARIDEVLTAVGMHDKRDHMPHQLSGGEQQRVAIARAILNRPKIIIADEPTGNLDFETTREIISLLKDISKTGTAVVITTHNTLLLEKFPGITYRCIDGKLVEERA